MEHREKEGPHEDRTPAIVSDVPGMTPPTGVVPPDVGEGSEEEDAQRT